MIRKAIAATLLFGAALPAAVNAETFDTCNSFIESVPATISTQGVHCLNKDLATNQSAGAAITVDTNNVTIDCNGYKLGGLAAGAGTGAIGILASNKQNLIVRNCNIRGFQKGVDASGGGHLIENNNFNGNTQTGVDVDGDGCLVRNNIVTDTGGGTGNTAAHGIFGHDNTDIRDNVVDGVFGTSGSNTTVYGIRLTGGSGATVSRNVVRNLEPEGTGDARGIYTSNGNKIFIDDNRVSLSVADAGSLAYRCNSSNGSMRNNSGWGFASFISGCFNDGGNVSH